MRRDEQGLSADGGDAPRELWIGPHFLRYEPPDLFFIRLIGDFSGPQIVRAHEAIAALRGDTRDLLFLLFDMSRLEHLSKEARRAAVGPTAPKDIGGLAAFGASFTLRTLTTLIMKAYELFKRSDDAAVAFFDTEAKARAWLAERRGLS